MGNVQIIVDAETARAYEQFDKLVQQQAKLEGATKKTAGAFGEVSKANMKAGQVAKESGNEMLQALRSSGAAALGVAAAVSGVASMWNKATKELADYRRKQLDLASLEDVKKTPMIKNIIDNPKFRGVSSEFKFGLFAGLQQELGTDEAGKAFKTAARAGLVLPGGQGQAFGQLFGQLKELLPSLKNRDVLDASMSVFQRLRGDIGKFDVKSVEQLVSAGVAPGRAIGTALSFGRTEQGARALQAMVDLSGQEKEFAAPGFGRSLTDKEKAERAFFAMGQGQRLQSLLSGENLEMLGGQAAEARIGLGGASELSQAFVGDVTGNRAGQQIRAIMEDPALREHFVDMLAEDHYERNTRGADLTDIPLLGSLIDPIQRWSSRKQSESEADRQLGGFLGSGLLDRERGPEKDRLINALEGNTSATRENTGGGFNGGVE